MAEKEAGLRRLVKHVGGTGEFIRFDASRCTGCGKCARICPMGIWGVRKRKATLSKVYTEKCVECGSCWLVCDSDAIDFSYPRGGTGVVWQHG